MVFAESWTRPCAAPYCSASLLAPCFSQLDPPESGGGLVLQERWDPPESHMRTSSRSCFLLRTSAQCGCLPGFSPLCFWSFLTAALRSALATAASLCFSHTPPVFLAQSSPPRGRTGRTRAQPSWDPASLHSLPRSCFSQSTQHPAPHGGNAFDSFGKVTPRSPWPPHPEGSSNTSSDTPTSQLPLAHRISSLPPCSLITSVSSLSLGDGNARRSRNGVQAQS